VKLTKLGEKAVKLSVQDRKLVGAKVVKGEDITKYTQGAVCYDAAAFVRFLLGNTITADDVVKVNGQSWESKLALKSGSAWNGTAGIPTGYALGFFRKPDKKFFHAAVSVGGTTIRAVNGGKLGAGWSSPVDLKKVLGAPDSDGWFAYDGTQIKVFMSKV
jgi:hypothetical protein